MFKQMRTRSRNGEITAPRHDTLRPLGSPLRATWLAALVACLVLLAPGLAGLQPSTAHADSATITDLPVTFSATAGVPFNGTVARFTDSNLSDTPATFTILVSLWNGQNDPGGMAVTGGNGTFTVQGSHTYAAPGRYTVTVELERFDGTTPPTFTTFTSTASVSASITELPMTFSATAGVPFSGTVARFTDSILSDTPATFNIILSLWNGPNDEGGMAVTGGNGTFTVQGSHTYAAPGRYTVTVEIERLDGTTATIFTLTSTAVVSACAPPTTAPSAYAQAVLADQPLGYWRLDDAATSGCVADSSGHGLTGIPSASGLTFGQPGALHSDADTAMAFDGQSGAITLGDPPSLQPAQVSVEAWVKTTSTPNAANIIVRKRYYGYALYLNASGQPVFSIDDSNATPWLVQDPTSVADGTWHYLVGTYDGTDVRLYVDGVLVRTRPAGTIYYQPDAVAIGRDGGYAGSYFTGQIDEVAIYGAALSASQVQAHYAAGSKQMSTTTLTMTPNPAEVGQPYAVTATVRGAAGTPTGTVNFCLSFQGSGYCTPQPLNSSGVATESFTAIQNSEIEPGTYTETAVYQGDATYAGSTSAPLTEVFNQAKTGVSLVSSANPATVGQTVTFTATVHVLAPGSGSPTGTVTFKDGSTVLGTVGVGFPATETFTTSKLAAGTHSITAVYSGDTQFIGSSSTPLSQVVNPAQTQPVSLFTTQTPAGVTYKGAYELGIEFQSTVAGRITGLRFYKAPGETGTHTGHLWSASGTLLGSVTFANETASGWQTATFATPIPISAGTTYVASFNSNTTFGATVGGLKTSVTNGPLATVADGKDGPYTTKVGTFPTTGSGGNNYFIDVLFVSP